MRFTSFFEESDFGTMLAAAGFPSYGLTYPHVYHLWGATFQESPELDPHGTMRRSHDAYVEKWEVPEAHYEHPFNYTNPKFMGAIQRQRIHWLGADGKTYEAWDG